MAARQYEGELDRARLPRLSAVALPCRALAVRVEFTRPAGTLRDVVCVTLRATGRFELTCQRCLEPMEVARDVASQVLLAASEGVARQLERTAEVQVSPPGELLDLAALVEDEVMLALPFAPRHEDGQCRPVSAAERGQGDGSDATDAGDCEEARENPFAVLAELKRRRHED